MLAWLSSLRLQLGWLRMACDLLWRAGSHDRPFTSRKVFRGEFPAVAEKPSPHAGVFPSVVSLGVVIVPKTMAQARDDGHQQQTLAATIAPTTAAIQW